MSLQNDPRYFPQPNVPTNGNYSQNFGKEQLYQAYLPRSANVDLENAAAGPKIPGNGKYVFNPATGQYTWISSTATTTNTTPAATQQNQGGGGSNAGLSGADGYGYGSEAGAVNSNALSTAGSIALGKLANMFNLGDTTNYNPSVSDMGSTDMSVAGQDKGAFLPNAAVPAANPMGMDPSQMTQGISAANPMSADPAQAQASMGVGSQRGGESVGGYAPGSQAGAAAAAGTVGGYGPGTPGFGSGRDGGDSGGAGGGGGTTGGGEGGGSASGGGDRGTRGGFADGGISAFAAGGIGDLGCYSDGGRLLRGPGDGVSDSIPAIIGKKRPARLADGEFVVPARIVSELGNGSTEAGARKLYAMLDRIQAGRKKSIGKGKVATNSRMDKNLPA